MRSFSAKRFNIWCGVSRPRMIGEGSLVGIAGWLLGWTPFIYWSLSVLESILYRCWYPLKNEKRKDTRAPSGTYNDQTSCTRDVLFESISRQVNAPELGRSEFWKRCQMRRGCHLAKTGSGLGQMQNALPWLVNSCRIMNLKTYSVLINEDDSHGTDSWRTLRALLTSGDLWQEIGDVHSEILSIAWQKTASENNLLLDSKF